MTTNLDTNHEITKMKTKLNCQKWQKKHIRFNPPFSKNASNNTGKYSIGKLFKQPQISKNIQQK